MSTISKQNNNSTVFSPAKGERGAMTSVCMLLCILAIVTYIRFGRDILTQAYSLEIHLMIVSLLAVITLASVGCQIHMIIKGEKSPRQLKRILKRQLKDLSIATTTGLQRLSEIEKTLSWKSKTVRPIAFEHGSRAQELISRVIHRGREVESLLSRRNKGSIFAAADLISSPLAPFENSQETLIKARPLPTLDPEQWLPTLEQLLQATEFEVNRAEERIRKEEAFV